jgi:hypothetical protein
MKINFDAEILDLDGKPLVDGAPGKTMTLASVSCASLINMLREDESIPADDKVKMFRIAQLACKGGEQEIKTEDVALLKKRIGKMYGALIVGRAYDLIEGECQ